jgi:hypothetical protein
MRDISKNVRDDIMAVVLAETGFIKSAYNALEAFYLLSFPSNATVYCFDMRGMLEDGSARVTIWNNIEPLCFHTIRSGYLYMGHSAGITQYSSYTDNTASYSFRYFTNPMFFGNASTLKFLKRIAVTVIGGPDILINFNWAYDYAQNFSTAQKTITTGELADFNTAEYGTGEYGEGILTARSAVNTSGSGFSSTLGITSTIDGSPMSIQQIDALALLGRLI